MVPMHDFQPGDYLSGWSGTYCVIEVTSATTVTVRRVYWWERLRFWIADAWFMFWLDVRFYWRKLKNRFSSTRTNLK